MYIYLDVEKLYCYISVAIYHFRQVLDRYEHALNITEIEYWLTDYGRQMKD